MYNGTLKNKKQTYFLKYLEYIIIKSMASLIVSSDNDVNLRMSKLQVVFQRAVDVSINSVGESDLDASFGKDVKSKFGNIMNKLFMNMLTKTQNNMMV